MNFDNFFCFSHLDNISLGLKIVHGQLALEYQNPEGKLITTFFNLSGSILNPLNDSNSLLRDVSCIISRSLKLLGESLFKNVWNNGALRKCLDFANKTMRLTY